MFNLLFASGHGGSTREILELCNQTRVKLSLPGRGTQKVLRHLATEEEAQRLNISCYSTVEDIIQAQHNSAFQGWLVARPETIEGIREQIGTLVPIAARHSVNSFTKYKKLKLKSFMSPSRHALKEMNVQNSFLSVKVRDHKYYDKTYPLRPAIHRSGYFSYIHHYQKYWGRAYDFFNQICSIVDNAVLIDNFGKDSEKGIINDHETMSKSKATIHIKDGQVCCNAPITSISLGIPVLMDYETLDKLGMQDYIIHNVSGLLFETPEECVNWIRILETDAEYLDQLSQRTRAFAKIKCVYSKNDLVQFRNFLYRMS